MFKEVKMKHIFVIFLFLNMHLATLGAIMGKIDHNTMNYQNRIVDSKSNKPLSNAKITIPEIHYTTYSDHNGVFQLNADVADKTVLFVEKDGYKTFSLTVDNSVIKGPLKLGIEQSNPFDMQITSGVMHLGDNMFSPNSANSSDFRIGANGYYMAQNFKRPMSNQNQDVVVKIGTIIGIDTKKAKLQGQNKIAKVYSSATEVFVNGYKIASIELNGDNLEFKIPKNILKEDNELIIQTGRNLFQFDYVDYDDIELANVRIEVKQKQFWARK